MQPQQRAQSDQTRAARRALQPAARRHEQRAISGTKLRPRDLAAQDLELVAQDEQLDVLHVQATATPNERPQQGP
jgi:predicted N-acetyltransferase YhbS